jgi:SSS family solute:Na+ symporter
MAAAIHHGLTLPSHALTGVKGGWIAVIHHYPSEMAQNFWTAIFAWSCCFVVTILVSLATAAPDSKRLPGLVYSETPRIDDSGMRWFARPKVLGLLAIAAVVTLNVLFW